MGKVNSKETGRSVHSGDPGYAEGCTNGQEEGSG